VDKRKCERSPMFGRFVGLLMCFLFVSSLAQAGPLRDWLAKRHAEREQQSGGNTPEDAAAESKKVTLVVDGLKREYLIYAPRNVSGSLEPLIIVLHGTYGTGEKMEVGLGFDAYAQNKGFIVAYPDAYHRPGSRQTARWNDGRGTLPSSKEGVDDVKFIVNMVADISKRYPIDKSRVFVTGSSNGGIMAYRLGCETHGVFKSIAPEIGQVASSLASSCRPDSGLSVLSINGSADPIIPLDGGEVCKNVSKLFCEGGVVLSREQSVRFFATADHCGPATSFSRASKVQDGTYVQQIDYPGCRASQVRSLVVQGMGHVWPPRRGQTHASGPSSQNLDATSEIVDFFLQL
jgi:polyhydroxybutyrate depolymerase